MLVSLRSRLFSTPIARASGSQRAAGAALPARSKFALTAGFIIAASGAALLGPHLGSVLAGGDDHASFWRAESARKAAERRAAAPVVSSGRGFKREEPPRGMSAYAPVTHPRTPPAPSPVWSFQPPQFPGADRPQQVARPKAADVGRRRPAASRLVCVRLCDGYFFPAPLGAGASDSGCAAACPNAPTRLYSMRSDRITDAVSMRTGAPYARLPVALHYTRVREQTCSCGALDPRTAIMRDATLRRGDRFMTENGFLIYQGRAGASLSRKSFAPLARARGLSRSERGLLMAMERASLSRPAERLAVAPPAQSHASLGPPRAATVIFR